MHNRVSTSDIPYSTTTASTFLWTGGIAHTGDTVSIVIKSGSTTYPTIQFQITTETDPASVATSVVSHIASTVPQVTATAATGSNKITITQSGSAVLTATATTTCASGSTRGGGREVNMIS